MHVIGGRGKSSVEGKPFVITRLCVCTEPFSTIKISIMYNLYKSLEEIIGKKAGAWCTQRPIHPLQVGSDLTRNYGAR